MIKLKLLKEDIESDYKAHYSDIDRSVFDQILAMDPQAKGNQIGSAAKSLLLRCYQNGEKDFLDKANEIRSAIMTFTTTIRRDPNIPGELKNLNNFPSVDSFLKFIQDPEHKPIETITSTSDKKEGQPEESKLDIAYKQYYADKLDKDTFDKIANADPETSKNGLGSTAKNFILPKYLGGTSEDKSYILNNLEVIREAILSYIKNKKSFNSAHQDLSGFSTVQEFVQISTGGEQSDLISYLKSLGPAVWAECNYLGSTFLHDVFQPTTRRAAAYIAGAGPNWIGAAQSGTRIVDAASPQAYAARYTSAAFAHWCTIASGSYWTNTGASYRGNSSGLYYDFMAKGDKLWANNRKNNYQFGIDSAGHIWGAADGEEDWTHASAMFPRLISEDPDILPFCDHRGGRLALIPEVIAYKALKKYSERPFHYIGSQSVQDMQNETKEQFDQVKTFVKELIIEEGVEIIPEAEFFGWTGIEKITFPNSLKQIKAQAFKNCSNLQLLNLPNNLEYIGNQAFAFCDSLHGTIKIPSTMKYIGEKAFYGTDIKALSIPSNTPEGNINIAPDDWNWYAKKAKIVKAESLDNVDINEDVLDEKIPADLARIYKSNKNISRARATSNRGHDFNPRDLNTILARKHIPYDYEAATYEVISVPQAIERIRNDKASVEKIRAICGDDYLELELRDNGKIYPIHSPASMGPYSLDNIRHQVQSIPGLERVLNYADKIYWTDEYDHAFDIAYVQNRNARSSEKITGINNITRMAHPDTGSHGPYNAPLHIRDSSDQLIDYVPDDVMNNDVISEGSIYQNIIKYNNSIYNKNVVLNKLKQHKKALQQLLSNADMYSEEELATEKASLESKIQQLQTKYQQLKEDYKTSKAIIEQIFNQEYIQWFNKTKSELAELEAKYKEKEDAFRKAQSDLQAYRTKSVKDDPEYKKIQNNVNYCQTHLDELNASKDALQERISATKEQILHLQEMITTCETQIQNIDQKELPEAIAQLQKTKASVDQAVEVISEKMSHEISELESTIEEIKKWYNEHPNDAYGKSFSMTSKSEMDPEVAKKLTPKEKSEMPEITILDECIKKFGVPFEKLVEICEQEQSMRWYSKDGLKHLNNPLCGRHFAQKFENLNQSYEYWAQEWGEPVEEAEKHIDEMLQQIVDKYNSESY